MLPTRLLPSWLRCRPGGPESRRGVRRFELGSNDPKAAAAWAGGFPEGNTREQAINTVMSSWAHNYPAGAGQWLATLPAGKAQERAIQSYVSQLSYQYPEMAAPWAERIPDENQRLFSIENVARQWLEVDRRSAEAWLNNTSLPQDRKQRLLRQVERR